MALFYFMGKEVKKTMKKLIILSVVMLIIGLLAGCWTTPEPVIDEIGDVDTRALYGVFDLTGYNSSTINSVMASYNTPQKIVSYMRSHFTKVDYHRTAWSPYQFYQYKWGDCNDFSTYAIYCAYKNGHPKNRLYQVYIKYTNGKAHMLAIYTWAGGYYAYSSNKDYYDDASLYGWFECVRHHDRLVPATVRYADLYDYDLDKIMRWYFN